MEARRPVQFCSLGWCPSMPGTSQPLARNACTPTIWTGEALCYQLAATWRPCTQGPICVLSFLGGISACVGLRPCGGAAGQEALQPYGLWREGCSCGGAAGHEALQPRGHRGTTMHSCGGAAGQEAQQPCGLWSRGMLLWKGRRPRSAAAPWAHEQQPCVPVEGPQVKKRCSPVCSLHLVPGPVPGPLLHLLPSNPRPLEPSPLAAALAARLQPHLSIVQSGADACIQLHT